MHLRTLFQYQLPPAVAATPDAITLFMKRRRLSLAFISPPKMAEHSLNIIASSMRRILSGPKRGACAPVDSRVQVTLRVLVLLCGLTSASLAAAYLVDRWSSAQAIDHWLFASTLFIASWGFGFSALALAIAWRGSATLAVYVGGLFFATFSAAWSLIVLLENPFEITPLFVLGGISYSLAIQFTQRYPRPLTAADVDGIEGKWFRYSGAVPLKALLNPMVFWPAAVAMEVIVHGTHIELLGLLHVLVWLTLAGSYLYVGYRSGSEDERKRLYWIFEGVLAMLVIELAEFSLWVIQRLSILEFEMAPFNAWLGALQGVAGLTCFALAMFWAGAFDSRLVLRKTAVVSAAASVVVIVFVGLEEFVMDVVGDAFGFESRMSAVIGGVLAALAFKPVSTRVERMIRGR